MNQDWWNFHYGNIFIEPNPFTGIQVGVGGLKDAFIVHLVPSSLLYPPQNHTSFYEQMVLHFPVWAEKLVDSLGTWVDCPVRIDT